MSIHIYTVIESAICDQRVFVLYFFIIIFESLSAKYPYPDRPVDSTRTDRRDSPPDSCTPAHGCAPRNSIRSHRCPNKGSHSFHYGKPCHHDNRHGRGTRHGDSTRWDCRCIQLDTSRPRARPASLGTVRLRRTDCASILGL